jgi:hypothetical protein
MEICPVFKVGFRKTQTDTVQKTHHATKDFTVFTKHKGTPVKEKIEK